MARNMEMYRQIISAAGAVCGGLCLFILNDIKTDIRDLRADISNIKEISTSNSTRIDALEKKLVVNYPLPIRENNDPPLFTSTYWIIPEKETL